MAIFDQEINRKDTYSYKWDVLDNELPMWVADMDFACPECVQKALLRRVKHGVFGYSIIPDEFFDVINKWWKKRHHFNFKKEWMIYSSGVVAAISSMVRKLTTVGENICVLSPVYNIFYNSILNNGRNIVTSNFKYENHQYSIDFTDLENKLALKQTSLLILCNPHNPIGKIFTKEELIKIGDLCYKYHVLVISDEIHCDIVIPGKEYIPFASVSKINKEISLTCVSSSKCFNMAGLQSSCIIVPNKNLRHKVWRGINTDEVGEPNAFSMVANIAAFKHGEKWLNELNMYLYENRKLVKEFIEENLPNIYLIDSVATYLLWIDVSSYHIDSRELCKKIRELTGLYLCAGSEYGENGKYFVRMNIATSKTRVIDGLNRLKNALNSL